MVKEDKKEYFMCQYSTFDGKDENAKKKNDVPPQEFELWIFEEVPAHNLNFEGN